MAPTRRRTRGCVGVAGVGMPVGGTTKFSRSRTIYGAPAISSMKRLIVFASFATVLSTTVAPVNADDSDVRVNVYKGPTECSGPNKVKEGNSVAIHYDSYIDESSREGVKGKKVDSSRDRGVGAAVTVGRGKVIQGLDIGLMGLCKGSYATIVVPPHFAYGDTGNGPDVPGGTTIKYDLEILDVTPEQQGGDAPAPNEFAKIDTDRDGRLSREEASKYFDSKNQPIDIDGLWAAEDKDSDGYISWGEFTGPKGDGPPRQQRKKDGGTEQRRQKKRQEEKQRPPPKQEPKQEQEEQSAAEQVARIFHQMDADKDMKLSREELSGVFKAMGQEMTDEFWDESDGDGNGYVSFEEFLGPKGGGGKKDEL